MSTLLAKLQESQVANSTTQPTNAPGQLLYRHPHANDKFTASDSAPVTPLSDRMAHNSNSSPSDSLSMNTVTAAELADLKRQLAARDQQLAAMQQELEQSRFAVSSVSEGTEGLVEVHLRGGEVRRDISDGTISRLQDVLNAATRPVTSARQGAWNNNETENSDDDDSALNLVPGRNMWSNTVLNGELTLDSMAVSTSQSHNFTTAIANGNGNFAITSGPFIQPIQSQAYLPATAVPQRHVVSPLRIDTSRNLNGYTNSSQSAPLTTRDLPALQSIPPSRTGSAVDPRFMAYNSFSVGSPSLTIASTGVTPPVTPMPFGNNMNMFPPTNQYVPRPIGTRPSPPGSEYNGGVTGPWNNQSSSAKEPSYVPPVEPLNYNRLLQRNVSCNWDYLVDKIIHHNDQQASIFLQQKLKQVTAEQKYEIIQSIIGKAYPLMINRFGNFLVQRCFEHGTQEQIAAIANTIRGNTLTLSMDAFGCHVVQKAFDVVPEEYKAMMVHELLRNIPQSVCHRYSCHVWQKLFELRWSDSPPQIMKYVNEALSGMWHTVALGETGSLVVQNIFENCLEEDKRPCIDECLNAIDEISRGQFGNWCVQHICEHGAPRDRNWAIDHILRNAQEYSTDQYGSKVVEKCLKIGGDEFMTRYLDRVCEARTDRPRQAIIDIAGDQYGNYLVQWILANASPQHREIVSMHVRKHMVSLRGSKYGSRVAMLCCNPLSATRPGAPAGFQLNRYNSNTSSNSSMGNGRAPYNGAYR